jgi:hypothetical protein
VVGELGASLEIKTVPLGNPGAVGVKEIERIVCWPGANVKGNVGAVTANWVPTTWAWVIVMLEELALMRLSVATVLSPTITVPKFGVESLTTSPLGF